ncbi:MAG: hypothetical protein ACUVWR_17470 [Anaerolineae bacterium]
MRHPFRIVVVLVVAALGFAGYYFFLRSPKASAATDVSTATVQRGNLVATVNGSGNITSHRQASLLRRQRHGGGSARTGR